MPGLGQDHFRRYFHQAIIGTVAEEPNTTVAVHAADTKQVTGRWSSLIVVLLCFLPIFTTVLFGGVDNITWAMVPIIWAVLVALWLVICWKNVGLVLGTSSLYLPLIGLIVIGLLQLLPLAGDAGIAGATRSLSIDPYTTRLMLIRLLVYLVFLAGCMTYISTESRFRRVVLVVVIFAAVMAFVAIMQRLANPGGIYGLRETPQAVPFGPFVNQHHFAAFMEMTIGLTLGLIFGGVEGREKKALLAFAAILMAIAIVWTGSRGGLIGFMSVIILVVAANLFLGSGAKASASGQSKLVVAVGGATLVLLALGAVVYLGGADQLLRGVGINNPSGDITTGRAHFWPIALKVFLQHPIIGAGLDAFSMAYPLHDTWNGTMRVEQAHNDYLQILADGGLAGFACVAAFIFLLFRKAFTVISGSDGYRRAAAIGALAGCFGVMVHSFFDFPLRTPSNAFFFLLLAAVATMPVAVASQEQHRRRKHHRR